MGFESLPLTRLPRGLHFSCSNVHNVSAAKGEAGLQSRFPRVAPGETLTVAELDGPATITRLWFTFDWPGKDACPQSMMRNRSVVLRITWDGAASPAIHVPVGDFFCHPLGYDIAFENAFFSSPTGRSLLCYIPMPFRQRATIEIVNEFEERIVVFHDIRFLRGIEPDPDDGYLHAHFQRTMPSEPGMLHRILPRIEGRGRYLGAHLGVITDRFNPLEWHGMQPAFFIDDDKQPSMLGASLDDFAGASWAYDTPYMHQDSGLLVSRSFSLGGGHYGFYYYHRRDPILFDRSCEVTIRPVIGMNAGGLASLLEEYPGIANRLGLPDLTLAELKRRTTAGKDDWFECGRYDDLSSVAFVMRDRPEGEHALPSKPDRCAAGWRWPAPDAHRLLPDA